jgi:hypothetical protein
MASILDFSGDNIVDETPLYKDPTQEPAFQGNPTYVDPFTIAAKKIQERPINSDSNVLDLPDINYINQQEAMINAPSNPFFIPQMSKPREQRRPDYGRQMSNAEGQKSTRAKLIDLIYDEDGNIKNNSLYGKYKSEIEKMNADENYLMNLSPLANENLADADLNENETPMSAKQEVNKQLTSAASIAKMEDDTIPTGLTGKAFEKWMSKAGDDQMHTYYDIFYDKRKQKGEKITDKNFEVIKQQMNNYIGSPLYSERQANFQEEYPNKNPDPKFEDYFNEFGKKVPEWKKEKRANLLNELKFNLDNSGKDVAHFNDNQVGPSAIHLSPYWADTAIAHEMGHSLLEYKALLNDEQKAKMKESGGVLSEDDQLGYPGHSSDIYNAINFKRKNEATLDSLKDRTDPALNKGEIEMFYNLAKPLKLTTDNLKHEYVDTFKTDRELTPSDRAKIKYNKELDEYSKRVRDAFSSFLHFNKDFKNKAQFVEEQYGDLNGVRQLLLREGVTNSFGEELDEDKMNKAILNKNITDDPAFRRFYFRYGKDNIIKLNNTIAKNNSKNKGKSLMDVASA